VGWTSGQHNTKVRQFIAAYEDQPDNWAFSHIVKFFVQKERRREDIGANLLAVFERDAQDAGRDLIVVSPDENGERERLVSFYREHGYEFMDPSSDRSWLPAWFMTKTLPVLR
jgi:GNAT superfamily N-acetyltransferase